MHVTEKQETARQLRDQEEPQALPSVGEAEGRRHFQSLEVRKDWS